MKTYDFHLIEVVRPDRSIKTADFCLIIIKENKRRVFLLNYPVYGILSDFNYFKKIIFN